MSLILCPECKKEISDEASSCPNCGFTLPKADKVEDPNKNGGCGCLPLIIITLLIGLVYGFFDSRDYEIKDNIAYRLVEIKSYDASSDTVRKIMEYAYNIAHREPSISKIQITCVLSPTRFKDSYGNQVKGDYNHKGTDYLKMGDLIFSREGIDNMLKYKDSSYYTENTIEAAWIYHQVRSFNYSYLISK